MSEIQPEAPVSGHTARRLATRRRLIQAGTELFAEGGLHAVTSTEIARRAGVATGTFYLHFPDKHALFDELVQTALDELRGEDDPGDEPPRSGEERRRQLELLLLRAERKRDLIRAVFDRGVESSAIAERIHEQVAGRAAARFSRIEEEGPLPFHPGAAAQAHAAILIRVIAWWVEDPSRASRAQVVDTLLQLDPIQRAGAGSGPASH